MKYNLKKTTSRAFLVYACINVFTYLFAHVAYLFASDVIGETFEYLSYYLSKTVEFLAPPILSTLALCVLLSYGKSALVKFTLTVASARLFYSLPYYYIIFIYNHGYDSIEAISLSLLATALVILLTALGILLSLVIFYSVLSRQCKKSKKSRDEALSEVLTKSVATDFICHKNTPVLIFALLRFTFSFVMELIDTVAFFIEYRSDYIAKEIITILANFTLLFALLVASYLIAANIKNALVDNKEQSNCQ